MLHEFFWGDFSPLDSYALEYYYLVLETIFKNCCLSLNPSQFEGFVVTLFVIVRRAWESQYWPGDQSPYHHHPGDNWQSWEEEEDDDEE